MKSFPSTRLSTVRWESFYPLVIHCTGSADTATTAAPAPKPMLASSATSTRSPDRFTSTAVQLIPPSSWLSRSVGYHDRPTTAGYAPRALAPWGTCPANRRGPTSIPGRSTCAVSAIAMPGGVGANVSVGPGSWLESLRHTPDSASSSVHMAA